MDLSTPDSLIPPEPETLNAPERKGPWPFWFTLAFAFVSLVLFAITSGGVQMIILVAHFFPDLDRFMMPDESLAVLMNAENLALSYAAGIIPSIAFLALFIYVRRGPGFWDYLGFDRFRKRDLALWFGILAAYSVGTDILSTYLDRPIPDFMIQVATNGSRIALVFAVVLCAPVYEELVFRGFFFKTIETIRSRVWQTLGVVFLPVFLFTLLHITQYDWYELSLVLGMGFILTLARWHGKSIWIPIILHAIQNGVATLTTLLYVEGIYQ